MSISSDDTINQQIPVEHRKIAITLSFDDDTTKTLDMPPCAIDSFEFKVQIELNESTTKRTLLFDTARLFDPLSTCWHRSLEKPKSFWNKVWQAGNDWDHQLTGDIKEDWSELHRLEDIRISRWLGKEHSKIELHGFCDASESSGRLRKNHRSPK